MKITDKWVVHETRDDRYFTGMDKENYPVLESLNSRVRLYKNKRAAECAIRHILQSGIEYCEFVAEYIEHLDVDDVPEDEKALGKDKLQYTDKQGNVWELLDKFGPVKYLRRKTESGTSFAMTNSGGDLLDLGDGELFAWHRYCKEREEAGAEVIRRRLVSEGKNPDGMDDWRDNK